MTTLAAGAPEAGDAIRTRDSSDAPPSIMFLSPSAQIGGAERVLVDMVASLRHANPEQRLSVIASADGPLVESAVALGARVKVLPFPPSLAKLGDAAAGAPSGPRAEAIRLLARTALAIPEVLRYIRELRRELRVDSPGIIHSNGAKMHVLSGIAGRGLAPVVWHMHEYLGKRRFMRRALRASVSSCSAVIANSASVGADARSVLGESVPIHTVLNAVDLGRFTPDGARLDIDSLAGLSQPPFGTVRIGLVATFARWKGHELFFRALAALPERVAVRAYVIGGPLYETQGSQYTVEELRSIAAEYGLGDRIAFTGHVSDVASVMRSLDVVVHASVAPEPFGLVIAEAMACGRAVITSGAGGALEFALNEKNALVFAPGDADSLARAIERLVECEALRSQLGAEGYHTATERFDRLRLAHALTPIYDQAILAGRA